MTKIFVDTNKFLIEEMIDGEEYAIDGYFDENNEATILNIFLHPFLHNPSIIFHCKTLAASCISTNVFDLICCSFCCIF